jgi:hypothetical protein
MIIDDYKYPLNTEERRSSWFNGLFSKQGDR